MSSDKRALLLTLVFIFLNIILNVDSLNQHPGSDFNYKNGSVRCFTRKSSIGRGIEWLFKSEINENQLDVKFFLTSRQYPNRVEVTLGNDFRLDQTDFRIDRRTVFIVHGFKSSGRKNWVDRMDTAFRLWNDVNVVIVDWGKYANTLNYYKAAEHVMPVGHKIVKFLSHVINATRDSTMNNNLNELNWGPIHMVGHSLGAHICGIAANEFKKISTLWNVTRITGLDPARPCFLRSNISLVKTDADFVDVIHTHGKPSSQFSFGLQEPIGHVDFYPNGGKKQPFCSRNNKPWYAILFNPKKWIKQKTCSHGLSHMYFTESLIAAAYNAGKFWAHEWDRSAQRAIEIIHETCDENNCIEMGINAENYYDNNNTVLGTFFVITASSPPYYDVHTSDLENLEAKIAAGSFLK
ncbi:pancreatic triacylglycerol lipase [Microplitis demolitor]|uniref:pancreatic triacylglycerol lipase n=1 Tax=Microplitis demolitor TaxID=69319 RepID=UPI00044002F1|nr:pancreatic triacylglycerol lipase [Microplitis demolitor]